MFRDKLSVRSLEVKKLKDILYQAKPSQAKVLTRDGDLREKKVHVPLFVRHSGV